MTQNVVPGIDFTNDPLLQGRNFSYLDTQLSRLGTPNFAQLPINAPRCAMMNFQRDGHMQFGLHPGRVSYSPSSLDPNSARENPVSGFVSTKEHIEADKLRIRPESFADHFSQARQFFMSQTEPEQNHIVSAFVFELSKVETKAIRERMVGQLANVDLQIAQRVAHGLGMQERISAVPAKLPARTDLADSPTLSILRKLKPSLEGKVIGCLVADGSDPALLVSLEKSASSMGAQVKVIAPKISVVGKGGSAMQADFQIAGGPSALSTASLWRCPLKAADLETQRLNLARIVGLPLGQHYTALNEYRFEPQVDFTLEAALHRAFEQRPDLQAANAGVKAAEASIKAAHAERLPSLNVSADFGAPGVTPIHESTGVYTVSGTLSIPIFEGGRIHGDIEQSSAVLRQRKSEYEDLRGQVDQDVRQAFIDMNLAADQVEVTKSSLELAHETLEQSRDRFVAGVTDTVELVQAQQSVAQADEDFITAVYEHNLAKVSLARAMGDAEQTLP